jgi:hypothetical protein
MQETCVSGSPGTIQSGYSDKPSSGAIADGVHIDNAHSATVVLAILCANVVQTHNLLRQLDVVLQIDGAAQVVEHVDEELLLAQELLGHLFTRLLALLLGSNLGYSLALLTGLFG